MKITIKTYKFYFTLNLIFSLIVYSLIYYKYIEHDIFFLSDYPFGLMRSFPSDFDTYSLVATTDDFKSYHRNYGPGIILYLFYNHLFICFLIHFFILYYIYFKFYQINKSILFLIFCQLPFLTLEILLPNKEIYSIYFIGFFLLSKIYNKKKYLLLSIIFSILSRPELLLFLIMIELALCLKINKYLFSIFIIIAISFFYNDFPRRTDWNDILQINNNNSILVYIENIISTYHLFFILFPIKILANVYDGKIINIIFFSSLLFYMFLSKVPKLYLFFTFNFIIFAIIPSFPHFRYLIPLYLVLFQIFTLKKFK